MTLLQLAMLAFWCLAGFAVVNALCTAFTLVVLLRHRPDIPADEALPKVAVLLCLRGADPHLADGLRRLRNQRYPCYEIFIAIDSDIDPAWGVVRQTLAEPGVCKANASTLRNRLKTCSLKCSSLVQLLDEIDDSFEVVVLADSDLESHATWLRELVAPLADPLVGATFGNRWFLPSIGGMGSLVRQLCNGIGIVTMHMWKIPWGGSLAIRAAVVRDGDLRQILAQSIVDDGPVRAAVKRQRLKLRFVPSLMMANREDCSLQFAHSYLTRQLKWTKTYMSVWWPLMLAYTLGVLGTYLATLVLSVICILQGFNTEAFWFAAAAAVYSGMVMTLWLLLDFASRRIVRAQGERASGIVGIQLLKIPVAMLLSVAIHISAIIHATFLRRVVWRGVAYEVHGPNDVRLLDDATQKVPVETPNLSL